MLLRRAEGLERPREVPAICEQEPPASGGGTLSPGAPQLLGARPERTQQGLRLIDLTKVDET